MILSVCPNPSIDTCARIDQFYPGQVNRMAKLREYPGGKGTHVAMAIRELGMETTLLGTWAGANGSWIKQKCNELNIDTKGIVIPNTNNRKCYTFRSKADQLDNTELLEPGPEMNMGDYSRFMNVYRQQAELSDLICMSGSWPAGAPGYAYAQAIGIANEIGSKMIIDCSGQQLQHALKHTFFGVHLNEHEAAELTGISNIEDCLTYLSKTIELVAITKGRDGLWLCYNNVVLHANVAIDKVYSTVGSGDCLTAGIAFAVQKGMDIENIARYGVACGAANCLYEGIGQLRLNDIEALLPEVSLKVLTCDG